MGRLRNAIIAGVAAAAIAAVAVGAALAVGPGFSGDSDGDPRGFRGHRHVVAGAHSAGQILSDLTGLTLEEIRDEVQGGSSLADIAEANGVSTGDYVAAVVDAATEAIDQAVADDKLTTERADEIKASLEDRVTEFVTRSGPFGPGHIRGLAKLRVGASPVTVLSELTGLSVEEIRDSRVEGTSLADIGEANGVSTDTYIDEVVTQASAAIDEMVAAGRLSEERAQEIKDGLQERVGSIVTNEDAPRSGHGFGHGCRGGRHFGSNGGRLGGPASQATPVFVPLAL